jgi:hypothetical protein
MFVAAWSFDFQFGTRDEATSTLKEFQSTMTKGPGWRGKRSRVLLGSIGAPESRITIEHEFESLADLEASWDALHRNSDMFRGWVTKMKSVVVPGSARWEIHRVLEIQ